MSHGSLPPTTMPACASASRTSSLARLVSNCDSSFVAADFAELDFAAVDFAAVDFAWVVLADTTDTRVLLHHTIEHEIDEPRRRQARAREHPRKTAGDEPIGPARGPWLAVAVAVTVRL